MSFKESLKRIPGNELAGRIARDGSVRQALFVFLLTRSLIFMIMVLTGHLVPAPATPENARTFPTLLQEPAISLQRAPVARNLRAIIARGDTNWYVGISQEGYRPNQSDVPNSVYRSYAFFPLYPLVLRLLTIAGGDAVWRGLHPSNIFFFLALVFLHKLAGTFGYDNDTANRTLFYVAAFPASYFFSVPMTESLFLLLTVGSFYSAQRDRWWLAGILGALASATRPNGILLVPALAVLYWQHHGRRPRVNVLGLLLVPTGLLAYAFYCWRATGNFLAFQQAQSAWGRQPGFFLAPMFEYVRHAPLVAEPWNFKLLNFSVAVLALVCTYLLARKRKWALALYTLLLVAMPLSTGTLLSFTRVTAVSFPVFFALADAGRAGRIDQTIRVVFVAALSLMTALFAAFVAFAIV